MKTSTILIIMDLTNEIVAFVTPTNQQYSILCLLFFVAPFVLVKNITEQFVYGLYETIYTLGSSGLFLIQCPKAAIIMVKIILINWLFHNQTMYYPLLIILNAIWDWKLFDVWTKFGSKQETSFSMDLNYFIRFFLDNIVCFVFLTIFMAQHLFLILIGIDNQYLSTWHYSCFYAFYIHNYSWDSQGWTLDMKLREFKKKWAYFGTTGLIHSQISPMWSNIIFPLQILHTHKITQMPSIVPINPFSFVIKFSRIWIELLYHPHIQQIILTSKERFIRYAENVFLFSIYFKYL